MTEAVAVPEVELPAGVPIVEGTPATTYKFVEDFQAKIAALALRDTQFMQRTEGLVKPEYFENIYDSYLVNIANRYFEKYRKAPGDKTTLAMLVRKDEISKIIKKEMMPGMVARIKHLYINDISDKDFVVEQCSGFARHQAVSAAILESVGHLDIDDFDRVSAVMKRALDVGEHADVGAYDYGAMLDVRTETRLDRAAGKLPPTGITTGYPEIDRVLYHKGWGKRELSVLMGAAKAGKTTALLDFGVSAIGSIMRYNVLYVTLEVSAEIIAERLDARISEHMVSELGIHIHDVKDKIKKFMDRAGKFIIREFPTGSMTTSDLRRMLERYKSQGVKFDMVIVDYADLMSPERFSDSSIENSKSVYVGLRGLAMQEDIAILTATQTNREGAKKMVATMTDVADDFNKIRIADIVISINRTEEERSIKQARLYFVACRNQAAGFSIRVQQDLERMRFIKEVIGEE